VDAGFYNNSCEALPAGTGIRCIVRDENNQVIFLMTGLFNLHEAVYFIISLLKYMYDSMS
jgi:hypothetical protein